MSPGGGTEARNHCRGSAGYWHTSFVCSGQPPGGCSLTSDSYSLSGDFAGRYDIIGEVGRGGSSIVYRAHDRVAGREVAIKILRTELAQSIGEFLLSHDDIRIPEIGRYLSVNDAYEQYWSEPVRALMRREIDRLLPSFLAQERAQEGATQGDA